MPNCICHTEIVAFGYVDCLACLDAIANDEVVTYDDLIATHHQALLDEEEVDTCRLHFHAVIVDYWNRQGVCNA